MMVAFSISPGGVGESVSGLVADCVRIVRESGLENRTDAMFTTVEGDWDEVMAVVKRCVDHVAAHAPRVGLVLKADHRPGHPQTMADKVASVDRRLAEQ
ncbi:MAG: MTH1187 family thiamine-binding protein [Acidimicrobiia bacterium]|nr:MTH1187 family thiamine-binding protein [Acidimicrobiia bacterium]